MTLNFLARVVFFNLEQGGRPTPPQSGFHPQLELEQEYTSWTVESVVDGVETMPFDIEHEVRLIPLFPERVGASLAPGDEVRLFEGSRLIGKGIVTNVLRGCDAD